MKRALTVLSLVALGALFLGTLWFLWKKSQAPPEVFQTMSPAVHDIVRKAVATGSVVPRKEVTLKPQVSGIVEKIHVEPGQTVKAGDVVATIRVIPDSQALSSAESRLNRARIALEDARKNVERQRKLHAEGTISEAVLQEAETTFSQSREEVSASADNLEIIRRGASSRGGQVTNTLVRSTVDGMVLEVPVEEGASVIEANTFNDGTTIASVANMGELIFEGKVDESEVGRLQPGMKLVLTIGAIDNRKFDAVLEHVAPKGVLDAGTIKFEIRAALSKQEDVFVRANYSANADIVLERRDQVLALDESLLQFEKGEPYVEVEKAPGVFERRDVKLGLSDGLRVELLDGLAATDKVKKPKLAG